MFKFITKVPYWYLIAIPVLSFFLGFASNQAVLIANGDKFPVMANAEKLQKFCAPVDTSEQAAIIKILTGRVPKHAQSVVTPDPYSCANGGEFMDDTHVIMTKSSHLKALADIFDLHQGIYSIGDFLLIFSGWMWEWAGIAWLSLVIRKFLAS